MDNSVKGTKLGRAPFQNDMIRNEFIEQKKRKMRLSIGIAVLSILISPFVQAAPHCEKGKLCEESCTREKNCQTASPKSCKPGKQPCGDTCIDKTKICHMDPAAGAAKAATVTSKIMPP